MYGYVSLVEIVDLSSAVEDIQGILRHLSWESDHDSVYRTDFFSAEENKNLSIQYRQSAEMCEKYLDGEVSIKDVITFLFKNDHECYLKNLEPYLTEEDRNFSLSFVQEDIMLTDEQWNEIDSICENNSQNVEDAPEESNLNNHGLNIPQQASTTDIHMISTSNHDDDDGDAIENLTEGQWSTLDDFTEEV
ncbi:hypothetical protein WA026_015990 [Henosepilachna vigintioctopunctata]|uniref:Uncharacterized protein n=1 Tax=Henosepilachna vigintioctopunctata TaxID=420089 RepID=A0AAW1TZD4_9CUCU